MWFLRLLTGAVCLCPLQHFPQVWWRVPSLIARGSSHHATFSHVLHDAPKRCTSFDKLQRSVKYTYVCSSKCVLACTHMHVSSVRKIFEFFVLFLHRLWATSNTLVSRHWTCNWSWGKDAKGRGQRKVLAYALVADERTMYPFYAVC